jgi:hypothetical protein
MIVRPSERREAERFALLLDEPGRSTDPELAPLVGLASRLTAVDTAGVDPAFQARLRRHLLSKAAWHGIGTEPAGTRRRRARWMVVRRAALATAAAAVVGLGSVGALSGNANPGDSLYGVKRAKESAQLALTPSDVSKGVRELQYAHTRLTEADSVVRKGGSVRPMLADMDAFTESGARRLTTTAVDRRQTAPLDAIDDFVGGQSTALQDLATQLPDADRDRMLDSLALLDRIKARSAALRATAECSRGSSDAGGDELGPYPRKCSAAPQPGSGPSGSTGGSADPSSGHGTRPGQPGSDPGSDPGSGPGGTDPGSGEGSDPGVLPTDPTAPLPDEPTQPVGDAVDGLGDAVSGVTDTVTGLLGG